MKTFRLQKLVRDNIVALMQEQGQTVEFRTLNDAEYLTALKAKMVEESDEFDSVSADPLSELADLQEVVDAAVLALGSTPEAFREQVKAKRGKRGAFTQKLFIESVTMPNDDLWATYYAGLPKRFPEITDTEFKKAN